AARCRNDKINMAFDIKSLICWAFTLPESALPATIRVTIANATREKWIGFINVLIDLDWM
ncbi:MAG: hypothetical protein AAGA30_09750, partial [Planctomycetota bacterium]